MSTVTRKLASIQMVNAVEPIPGADAIEKIRVLGWWVVARKGEYKVGDKVVYCEVDSILPEKPEFEFMRKSNFRVKTIKLRGQVSQGICFPLSILPEAEAAKGDGHDVTETLEITKFEPEIPVCLVGKVKGLFPAFLSKTDEPRVQLLESVLERHKGKKFYVTEKLDGMSFTAFLRDGKFGVCSRNLWLDETDESNSLVRAAKTMRLEEKLRELSSHFGFELAIQGEMIGPKIQGNKYGLSGLDFYVFNVINMSGYKLFGYQESEAYMSGCGIKTVPLADVITLNHSIDELVELSQGESRLREGVQREGIVLRPEREEYDRDIGRLSFKAINPKFLLKHGE